MAGVLVTGGSGYLGAELLRQLADAPWPVVTTYYSHQPPGNATCIALDLRQPGGAADLIAEVRPHFVIHSAYVQHDPGLQAVTVEGAAEVAQAAQAVGARLIHMSSDVIFDGLKSTPYGEDDAPSPVNAYGRAKAEAERRVAGAHPAALLVRTSLIYGGPGGQQPSNHEQLVLDAAHGRADVAFFSDEIRCPVVVGELAAALLELLETPHHGPLHVAGPEAISRFAFARLIAAAHGADPQRLRSARSADSPVPRPRNCTLDTQRVRRLLRTRLRGPSEVLS